MDIFESLSNFIKLVSNGKPIRVDGIGSKTDKFINRDTSVFIDTCFTCDTGKYETAIKIGDDKIVIVEDYDDPDDAKMGHERWVNTCKQDTFSFRSIQTGEVYFYKITCEMGIFLA